MIYKRDGDIGFDEARAAGELCELARKGDLERLKVMLGCGCDVASADYDQRTALHVPTQELEPRTSGAALTSPAFEPSRG